MDCSARKHAHETVLYISFGFFMGIAGTGCIGADPRLFIIACASGLCDPLSGDGHLRYLAKYLSGLWRLSVIWSRHVFWWWRVCVCINHAKNQCADSACHASGDFVLRCDGVYCWCDLCTTQRNLFFFLDAGVSNAVTQRNLNLDITNRR